MRTNTNNQESKARRFNVGKPKLSLLAPELWLALRDARKAVAGPVCPTISYARAGFVLSKVAHERMRIPGIHVELTTAAHLIQDGVRRTHSYMDDLHGGYSMYALLADAMEYGAGVYGRDNWKLGFPFTELIDASQRHLMKLCCMHSDLDEDSGVHHAGHAMFGINCMLYMLARDEMFKRFYDVAPLVPKEGV